MSNAARVSCHVPKGRCPAYTRFCLIPSSPPLLSLSSTIPSYTFPSSSLTSGTRIFHISIKDLSRNRILSRIRPFFFNRSFRPLSFIRVWILPYEYIPRVFSSAYCSKRYRSEVRDRQKRALWTLSSSSLANTTYAWSVSIKDLLRNYSISFFFFFFNSFTFYLFYLCGILCIVDFMRIASVTRVENMMRGYEYKVKLQVYYLFVFFLDSTTRISIIQSRE